MTRPTALITAATAGIGFHTAAALARAGMRVLVTGRDELRGRRAVSQLQSHAGHADVELIVADGLSIRENVFVAKETAARAGRIDALINNVGGAGFAERQETAEGLEATMALNFVGPFSLTTELLRILPVPPGRIVNVVSSAFAMWTSDPFEDLVGRRDYVALHAYGHAKLLNLLFTMTLARRLASASVVTAVNPGMAWTPGIAALTPQAIPHWRYIWPVVRWIQRRASAESASRSVVVLATADSAPPSGGYYDGRRRKELPPALREAHMQDRAWTVGEALVKAALGLVVNESPATRSSRL